MFAAYALKKLFSGVRENQLAQARPVLIEKNALSVRNKHFRTYKWFVENAARARSRQHIWFLPSAARFFSAFESQRENRFSCMHRLRHWWNMLMKALLVEYLRPRTKGICKSVTDGLVFGATVP